MVSNHGGRQLASEIAPIDALPLIEDHVVMCMPVVFTNSALNAVARSEERNQCGTPKSAAGVPRKSHKFSARFIPEYVLRDCQGG